MFSKIFRGKMVLKCEKTDQYAVRTAAAVQEVLAQDEEMLPDWLLGCEGTAVENRELPSAAFPCTVSFLKVQNQHEFVCHAIRALCDTLYRSLNGESGRSRHEWVRSLCLRAGLRN